MAKLLLIADDVDTAAECEATLRTAGHDVTTAGTGTRGLAAFERRAPRLVVSDLQLPDISGLDVLQQVRRRASTPVVMMTALGPIRDVVMAMRLGAADVLEKPIDAKDLLHTVDTILGEAPEDAGHADADGGEAYAAARWARLLAAVIDAPNDPRTIAVWGRLTFVSPGALRNWCWTAGLAPRRSLVFARLLRAVAQSGVRRNTPENLLDVVDRRTLVRLLRMAGFTSPEDLPSEIELFLRRQALVHDQHMLSELRRAMAARRHCEPAPVGR
jgi:CheY-like chemotaxis protein